MNQDKKDLRTSFSKEYIWDAIIDLTEKNKIKKLTIKNICEKAGVGRATFYRHFNSIDDVYEWQCEKLIAENKKLNKEAKPKKGKRFNLKQKKTILTLLHVKKMDKFLHYLNAEKEKKLFKTFENKYQREFMNNLIPHLWTELLKMSIKYEDQDIKIYLDSLTYFLDCLD